MGPATQAHRAATIFASGPINRNGRLWRLRSDAQGAVISDLLLCVYYHENKCLAHAKPSVAVQHSAINLRSDTNRTPEGDASIPGPHQHPRGNGPIPSAPENAAVFEPEPSPTTRRESRGGLVAIHHPPASDPAAFPKECSTVWAEDTHDHLPVHIPVIPRISCPSSCASLLCKNASRLLAHEFWLSTDRVWTNEVLAQRLSVAFP